MASVASELVYRSKKYRYFLYLSGGTDCLLFIVATAFLWLLLPGLRLYIPFFVPVAIGVFFLLALFFLTTNFLLWHICHHRGNCPPLILQIMGYYLHSTYAVKQWIGRRLGFLPNQTSQWFIDLMNRVTLVQQITVRPEELLLLTPHCLQNDQCAHKVTRDVHNCRQCGRCQVGDLLALAERYGIGFMIVTGGTLARQMIGQCRPKAVIAVACERDLMSGMNDVFPLPVIGLMNQRPHGPCFNTVVDTDKIEKVIQLFLFGDDYERT